MLMQRLGTQTCLPTAKPCSTRLAPALSKQPAVAGKRADLLVRRAQENQTQSSSTSPAQGQQGTPMEGTPDGFVGEDNSGKSNIFPNVNKPFISSPVSEEVASQGLGGAQGGAIVVGALVIILVLAVVVGQRGTGETLEQLQASGAQESLTEVARRLSGSSGF